MSLISIAEVDSRLNKTQYFSERMTKSAQKIFEEDTKRHPIDYKFDIFLSHSYSDAQVNLDRLFGLKALLEDFNYSVYVDWIIDKDLDRENVNESTAAVLRKRMSCSSCLLFATSENSQYSKWMPWELGYKDGQSSSNSDLGRVAILPLVQATGKTSYAGQEYLGIYPYINKEKNKVGDLRLWVCYDEATNTWITFDSWLKGSNPTKRN
jgi:hypothetical protein